MVDVDGEGAVGCRGTGVPFAIEPDASLSLGHSTDSPLAG